MEKKLQKIYVTYYNLLKAQDLCPAHYQILSIIFLKEFIALNVNIDMMIKNVKFVELNVSIATVLEYMNFKDNLIEYKCSCCNNNHQQKFDDKLKEHFFNTFKFSNHGSNKFILLLRKGICPYEYMDDWEKRNKTLLPEKEDFYSQLNMEDITDADYAQAKTACKDFEIKILVEYHDLYVQGGTLLLADVFENFRNIYLKIYELDPTKFHSAPGLA